MPPKNGEDEEMEEDSEVTGQDTSNTQKTWNAMLLDKFPSFEPSWPDDVKSKWFEAFQDLIRT